MQLALIRRNQASLLYWLHLVNPMFLLERVRGLAWSLVFLPRGVRRMVFRHITLPSSLKQKCPHWVDTSPSVIQEVQSLYLYYDGQTDGVDSGMVPPI